MVYTVFHAATGQTVQFRPADPVPTNYEYILAQNGFEIVSKAADSAAAGNGAPLPAAQPVLRLIMPGAGHVDTGATYPGCSRSNPSACRPLQFGNVEDAKAYALQNGEVPTLVESEAHAWAVAEGRAPIPAPLAVPGGLLKQYGIPMAIAAGALFYFGSKKK